MHNQVAPHAVRTALDLHIYIHTHLRFRPSAVVLQVLSDPEPTLYVRVTLKGFDHMMSRSQLTSVQKDIIIYIHSNTDLLNNISEVDVLNFCFKGVSNNLSLSVHKGSQFFQRSSLFV